MKPTRLTFHILSFSLLCVMVHSCSIHLEKRRYNPGYHLEVFKKHPTNVRPQVQNDLQKQTVESASLRCLHGSLEPVPTEQETTLQKETYSSHVLKHGGDDCDVAYLKNGKTFLCTYIQITDVIFTYKICGGKTTDVKSIDITKIDYIVLNKGDTIYPENKMNEWQKEHGATDEKIKRQLLNRGVGESKITSVLLYFIFGILAIAVGIPFLYWCIYSLGLWLLVGGFFLVFLAGALVIGGGILIILAIIHAVRK